MSRIKENRKRFSKQEDLVAYSIPCYASHGTPLYAATRYAAKPKDMLASALQYSPQLLQLPDFTAGV